MIQTKEQIQATQPYLDQLSCSSLQTYCLNSEENISQILSINRINQKVSLVFDFAFLSFFKQIQDLSHRIAQVNGCQIKSGRDLFNKQASNPVLPFGEETLDSLLESGLKCGKIYELSGMSCCGKSTLAQKLLAQTFGNTGKGGWFIDIIGQFNLNKFLVQNGLKERKKEFENRFYHSLAQDPKHLYMLICLLASQLSEKKHFNKENTSLLIIDNFDAIMKSGNVFNEYTSFSIQISQLLRHLCSAYNLTVLVITTQEEKISFKNKPEEIYRPKAALGSPWNYVPDCFILLDSSLLITGDSITRRMLTQYTLIKDLSFIEDNVATSVREY